MKRATSDGRSSTSHRPSKPRIGPESASGRILAWNTAGLVTVAALWLLLVPWDLSEVNAADQLRSEGGSHAWPWLILIVLIAAAAGGGLAYRRKAEVLSFLVGAYGRGAALQE